jgi:hypothetical protein
VAVKKALPDFHLRFELFAIIAGTQTGTTVAVARINSHDWPPLAAVPYAGDAFETLRRNGGTQQREREPPCS